MLLNERFPLINQRIPSLWLKKILKSNALKCSRMNDFQWLFREFLHHGWRKFWNPMVSKVEDSLNFKSRKLSICIIVEVNFEIWWSWRSQIRPVLNVTDCYFITMVEKCLKTDDLEGPRWAQCSTSHSVLFSTWLNKTMKLDSLIGS